MATITPSSIERFESKVNRGADCWTWSAGKTKDGYGQFYWSQKRGYAHRFAYELANGEIPGGMKVDHRCHNRACVNPSHLRLATNKQNMENISVLPRNKSGIRGVSWNARTQKWIGRVTHHGKEHFVGYHADIRSAEAAVTAKRNELFTHNLLDRQGGQVGSLSHLLKAS